MRYHIDHPTDPEISADYGWDQSIGFFVMVRRRQRILEDYDVMTEGYDHLDGVIKILIRHEFFDICEVIDAMYDLAHGLPEDLAPELRFVGDVICNLRAAADQD
ncbi:MAG: hypothetical protein RBU37_26205 [Myxococcota bacterium]|jgi:hypothetical protein|nr:hypothetical protein [Myxococcota bacterium]